MAATFLTVGGFHQLGKALKAEPPPPRGLIVSIRINRISIPQVPTRYWQYWNLGPQFQLQRSVFWLTNKTVWGFLVCAKVGTNLVSQWGKNWTSVWWVQGVICIFFAACLKLEKWRWKEAFVGIQPVKSLWNLLSYVYGTVYLMTDSICGVCPFCWGFFKSSGRFVCFWGYVFRQKS